MAPDTQASTAFADFLEQLSGSLNEEERSHFGVEVMDAVRENDMEQFVNVVDAWWFTVRVRNHPDYRVQLKEYWNLYTSGELFEGSNLEPGGHSAVG